MKGGDRLEEKEAREQALDQPQGDSMEGGTSVPPSHYSLHPLNILLWIFLILFIPEELIRHWLLAQIAKRRPLRDAQRDGDLSSR